MTKNIFSIMLTVLSMAVVVSFTSCGNSNDDEYNTEEESGTMGYKYVTPCLQWNATKDEVATYMAGISGFSLRTQQSQVEIYACNYPETDITYTYGLGMGLTGLSGVTVMYTSNKDSEFADLRSKIESTHSCTLLPKDGSSTHYIAEDVIINGRKTDIEVISMTVGTAGVMSVKYSIYY